MSNQPTKETFLRNVAGHTMTIHCDSGIHRHLTFSTQGSSVYKFHITTWPGYLAFSGDMGSFMFSRLPDMFDFFRDDNINPGYWAEKLTAHDKHGGHMQFSEEKFAEAIKQEFSYWSFDTEEDRAKSWAALVDDWGGILNRYDDARDAFDAAYSWKCPVTDQQFTDFWEYQLEDYSYRFIWCCYAIQWAIQHYDASRLAANDNAATDTPVSAAA